LHGVGLDRDALAFGRPRARDLLEGPLHAAAVFAIGPAVVAAAQTALLDEPFRKVRAAVRAMPIDEPMGSREVAIEDQVLAQDAQALHRLALQLVDGSYGVPVAAQEIAHRLSRADARQQTVLLFPHLNYINLSFLGRRACGRR